MRYKQKVKIMMVAPHLNLGGGGSERQTIALANGLAREGCEVTILLTDKKGALTSQFSSEVKVVSYGSRSNFFSRFRFIYETAKTEKPDILYSRFWTTKPAMIFAGKILGIKTVAAEVSNIKQSLRRWPPILRNAVGFAKVFCYQMADSVIVQSHAGRGSLFSLGVGEKMHTVHNGIDIERIDKQSGEGATHRWFDEQTPVVAAVGRLVKSKGYENLLETVSAVNEVAPLRLLLIGDGPLKTKIVSKARNLGIEDKIDFTGSVANPHKYAAKCDIFICSSLFEGFSNSLLEALAMGLPVVSTDHDFGAREIIENGRSGILVPVGNPEKMTEAVLRLLQDKTLAAKMGEEAKKRVQEFSIEKMIRENLRIFREIQKRQT